MWTASTDANVSCPERDFVIIVQVAPRATVRIISASRLPERFLS